MTHIGTGCFELRADLRLAPPVAVRKRFLILDDGDPDAK
jgi:hypothetical protein